MARPLDRARIDRTDRTEHAQMSDISSPALADIRDAVAAAQAALGDIVERLVLLLPPGSDEPTIRLTVDIPESLHSKLKAACAQNQQKIADVVRVMLEERFGQAA